MYGVSTLPSVANEAVKRTSPPRKLPLTEYSMTNQLDEDVPPYILYTSYCNLQGSSEKASVMEMFSLNSDAQLS